MFSVCYRYADVAELADALDLGSSGRPCRFNSCHPQAIKRLRRGVSQSFYVPEWNNRIAIDNDF